MKKILFIALALLTMGSQMEVSAAKKEKKGLKWEWDGTKSGNETIDNYLVQIDTLYRNLQAYQNAATNTFEYKADTLEIDGKPYILARMIDKGTGQIVTRGRVNWEFANAIMQGTSIVLAMTNAGLGSANAALALPQLGLKALKFGKYVKGGPTIISEGIKTIKVVRANYATDYQQWKGLKTGAVEDPSKLNIQGIDDDLVKKLNKCCYLTEIKEADPSYDKIQEVLKNKSDEEKAQESQTAFNDIKQATMAEEDAKKNREDDSDDAFMKEMEDNA
ncbi:MAG: hypothetical protein E7106_04180 [Prevotella sp.]|nr:hypothetical protein [Prevotella sp.]